MTIVKDMDAGEHREILLLSDGGPAVVVPHGLIHSSPPPLVQHQSLKWQVVDLMAQQKFPASQFQAVSSTLYTSFEARTLPCRSQSNPEAIPARPPGLTWNRGEVI